MKGILRVIFAGGIIALAILGTATSCGKVAGGNNNSGGGDNGGGDGNGGGGDTPKLAFNMTEPSSAKTNDAGAEILIKASGFPTDPAGATDKNFDVVVAAGPGTRKKIFSVSLNGSTGGLLLVGNGNLDSVSKFSMSSSKDDYWQTTSANFNSGIQIPPPLARASKDYKGINKPGLNIYSVFADKSTPADNVYAFSTAGGAQPIFYCVAVVSEVTNAEPATATLQGAQKADCYVSSFGAAGAGFGGEANAGTRGAWLTAIGADDDFKRSFNVVFAGIDTGAKPLPDIGHSEENTAEKRLSAFKDGVLATEMAKIVNANKAYKKEMTLTIVNDTDFADGTGIAGTGGNGNGGGGTPKPTTPAIIITNIKTDVVEVDEANKIIKLKASGFPTTAAPDNANINTFGLPTTLKALTKAFDVEITGGVVGTTPAKGGLVLVGTGNTDSNAFSIPKIDTRIFNDYSGGKLKEGIISASPREQGSSLKFYDVIGWRLFGAFMSTDIPDAGTIGPDISPFAFTKWTTVDGETTKPFLVCQTVISSITDHTAIEDSTKLTGGQKAECFVGASGAPFIGRIADAWLVKAATVGNTDFKSKFNIAAMGIRTDEKGIGQIGLDKKTDATPTTSATAVEDLKDGLDTKDMAALTAANPSDYKKYSVEIVKDDDFNYETPKILIHNFSGAKLIEGTGLGGATATIQIKGSAIPKEAVDTSFATTLNQLRLKALNADSLKPVFDITFTGGDKTTSITGGLIMVGPGNFDAVNSFSDKGRGPNYFPPHDPNGYDVNREGFFNGLAGNNINIHHGKNGWGFFGSFFSAAGVSSDETNANKSPFAFTSIRGTNVRTKLYTPIFYCVAVVSGVADETLEDDDTFAGGHTASCYVGYVGERNPDNNTTEEVWMAKPAGNNFKKAFNIAIGGFRTDNQTIVDIMPGDDAVPNTKINALNDGLQPADITYIMKDNPHAFKKITLTIVNDEEFDKD